MRNEVRVYLPHILSFYSGSIDHFYSPNRVSPYFKVCFNQTAILLSLVTSCGHGVVCSTEYAAPPLHSSYHYNLMVAPPDRLAVRGIFFDRNSPHLRAFLFFRAPCWQTAIFRLKQRRSALKHHESEISGRFRLGYIHSRRPG